MKIRTITIGFYINALYLNRAIKENDVEFESQLAAAWEKGKKMQHVLEQEYRYLVQTLRVTFNPFEEWLIPCIEEYNLRVEQVILYLDGLLTKYGIEMSSVGCNFAPTNLKNSHYIPQILKLSSKFSSSINFLSHQKELVTPRYEDCLVAAQICRQIAEDNGNLGNFRFCVGFDCPKNTPFYPISYHMPITGQETIPHISIGLENGDLIFLAGFAAGNLEEAKEQLYEVLKKSILPIQKILQEECTKAGIIYQGVDASINPGLLIQDSVGNGIEQLLINFATTEKDNTILMNPLPDTILFGKSGTLSVVSSITSALKQLEKDPELILTGYSGLMLPVMEDLILSARAASTPPLYGLRDLLVFSSICGVGLDTIPIPGNASVEDIARIYMEVGTLAFRLKKPLSCRLLPMQGLSAGDTTNVVSPYLCNTKVFAVK